MPTQRKFGTFSGVFTPSILTILGVIMYLRLGWVVGQAGLIAALGIIIFAHIISFTTGLSISSIATDKRIKTGGIYYILSRSLGLPMGGSIGITIFVGTALSISLYLIGFAENFLSIPVISNFLGLEPSISSYRIIGSVVLVFLAVIALISTSFAIKTQYVILGAIALSLISVFAGAFLNVDFRPAAAALKSIEGASIEQVFAIFFPAVTGFTAGVAMSGDLKDPKKNIPVGTMAAIFTGFVVYIALAIVFALFVDRDLLLNDTNFLMKIALYSPLVVAGVWGATLSSALGGILGAPRILQAISQDKITPAFLGKGYGVNNEPRNALIVTFLIAESGILIGELDVIASIVSMFYIAAYGFINLAFSLERWANSDFRPSFPVSKWVGITGFVVSFGIMFKIDTVAMFLALVIMFGIYFLLKRRTFDVDFGDVWRSVWQSVVRSSLHRIDRKAMSETDWQPNIMLFSSNTGAKPHLIEFGKDLVGHQGMLSNFDLIEVKNADVLFPKHRQVVQSGDDEKYEGVFTRRQECRDYYEGVEMIARTYGFAGIEPNTVLLNWEKQSKNPVRFAKTLRTLTELDLNILMMDYDFRFGFGQRKIIDIWWRGRGNNGKLALSLVKFIWLSENWKDSEIRLLIINNKNEDKQRIQREAEIMLENLRIKGVVIVINNEIVKRPFYEIIESESRDADLVILGMPEIVEGMEAGFVDRTNRLCRNVGTVLLIKASSFFEEYNVTQLEKKEVDGNFNKVLSGMFHNEPLPEIVFPPAEEPARHLELLKNQLDNVLSLTEHDFIIKAGDWYNHFIIELDLLVKETFDTLELKFEKGELTGANSLYKIQQNFIIKYRKLLNTVSLKELEIQKVLIDELIRNFEKRIEGLFESIPNVITKEIDIEELKNYPRKTSGFKVFMVIARLKKFFTRRNLQYKIKFSKIVKSFLKGKTPLAIYSMLLKFGVAGLQNITESREVAGAVVDGLNGFALKISKNSLDIKIIKEERIKLEKKLDEAKRLNITVFSTLSLMLKKDIYSALSGIGEVLSKPNSNKFINKKEKKKSIESIREKLNDLPGNWQKSQQLLYNYAILEAWLMSVKSKVSVIYLSIWKSFESTYVDKAVKSVDRIAEAYSGNTVQASLLVDGSAGFEFLRNYLRELISEAERRINQTSRNFPGIFEVMEKESFYEFETKQYEAVKTLKISASQLINYIIQSECITPLFNRLGKMLERIRELELKMKEAGSALTFSGGQGEAGEEVTTQGVKAANIEDLIKNTTALKQEFGDLFYQLFRNLDNVFTIHYFARSTGNLKHFVWRSETRKHLNTVKKLLLDTNKFFTHLTGQIWYKQSENIIRMNRIISDGDRITNANDLLDMLEMIKIDPATEKKIPFYYRQLFLSKQSNLQEFWTGRDEQMNEAGKAVKRFRAGYGGGILITGDRRSGRSFFVSVMAGKYLAKRNIYYVLPPVEGTPDVTKFRKIFSDAFESPESPDVILRELEEGSIIVLDDFEFFFERSANGLGIINELQRLIRNYGAKHLFVVTINIHTFNLIMKFTGFSASFLNVINLGPMSAEQLQEAVWLRHLSTNYKLIQDGKGKTTLKKWELAKIFASYFNITNGNPGSVLYFWVANIKEVKDKYFVIAKPKEPDISILGKLDFNYYDIMLQIIIHRALSFERLAKLLFPDDISQTKLQSLQNTLKSMQMAGIIYKTESGLFDIDKAVYPFVIKYFVSKEML